MAARQHDYGNAQRISQAYLLARWPQHAGDGLPEGIATRDPRAAWREEMSAKWRVRCAYRPWEMYVCGIRSVMAVAWRDKEGRGAKKKPCRRQSFSVHADTGRSRRNARNQNGISSSKSIGGSLEGADACCCGRDCAPPLNCAPPPCCCG